MTQLNIPYQFIAGTKAKANEVNANFDAVANEIDEIYSQILTNSNNVLSDLDALSDSIDNVDNKIDDFIDSYSPNTHFCVNKGSINSLTGEEDILSFSSTVISFNVTSNNPIKATTCSGTQFSIENIDDLFLPALNDGMYTIYVFPDGTVDYYSSVVQCVEVLPSSAYVNEVCLLIKNEPLEAYIYNGTSWDVFDGVPLGVFKMESGSISSICTLPYNQNGYNITMNSYSADIAENGWLQLPNGLIFQWGKYSFSASQVLNFPIAFPTQCFGVVAGDNYNDLGSSAHVNISVYSKSQFRAAEGMYSSAAMSGCAYVFAVGY